MKVIFEAIIDPIILQEQGWKRKNERYISPSFEVMKDKGIPQVLSFILIENYDKIKGGLVPRLPAHYTIKFCLEELIKGKRSDHTDPKRLIQAISKYFHCCQLFGEKLAHDECSIDQAQIIQEVCRTECDNNLS